MTLLLFAAQHFRKWNGRHRPVAAKDKTDKERQMKTGWSQCQLITLMAFTLFQSHIHAGKWDAASFSTYWWKNGIFKTLMNNVHKQPLFCFLGSTTGNIQFMRTHSDRWCNATAFLMSENIPYKSHSFAKFMTSNSNESLTVKFQLFSVMGT